jgi:hypothetical protein
MSPSAAKAARQDIRSWRLQLKSDKSLEDLARMFNPVIAAELFKKVGTSGLIAALSIRPRFRGLVG